MDDDHAAMDATSAEARIEALKAISKLDQAVRNESGITSSHYAIELGVLTQQVTEAVRVYRMATRWARRRDDERDDGR